MIEFVLGDDANVAAWVVQQLNRPIVFQPPYYAIGITLDGSPVAGVVYHNYREDIAAHPKGPRIARSIEASIASTTPRWCSRASLATVLRYPFAQLGCNRLNAMTHRNNKHARKFLKRIGFVEEGILRDWFARDDAVIYGLLSCDAQRWIGEANELWQGRQRLAASGA